MPEAVSSIADCAVGPWHKGPLGRGPLCEESYVILSWYDMHGSRILLFADGIGGGYVNPAVLGHAVFLGQCLEKLQGNGEKTVLAILEYGQYEFSLINYIFIG